MTNISAHDIFKQVKDEIFNLKSKGELEIPILHNEFHVPTEDDMLKAYWQSENEITVAYGGETKNVACNINSKNDEYIARCIMHGFAQIWLGQHPNESVNRTNLSKDDMMNVMESVITRLVNEGIMEMDDNEQDTDEEDEKEYHFIWENNKMILNLLYEIAGGYEYYVTCDIDKYDAFVDFGDVYIIVSMDDDGYIFVSKVEGSVLDDKQRSTEVWREVCDCINKINAVKTRPCDMQISGRRYSFESKMHEGRSFKNNQNYTHFAVNKNTGKIVNGWDYKGISGEELKQFKKDYFITDLVDYGLNAKDYKILTSNSLMKQGIDPNDNNNWANQ